VDLEMDRRNESNWNNLMEGICMLAGYNGGKRKENKRYFEN